MNFQISGQNVVVYRNTTSQTHFVALSASGRAEVEVRSETAGGQRHNVADHGGVISVEVPSNHRIEIDARTPDRRVEASIMSVR